MNFEYEQTIVHKAKGHTHVVHKCAETIQGRKLFKSGNYMRKYAIRETFVFMHLCKNDCTYYTPDIKVRVSLRFEFQTGHSS